MPTPVPPMTKLPIGKATNLKNRLNGYNVGRPIGDRYYYVYIWSTPDCSLLEKKITKHLYQWQDAKDREMYVINYDWLYLYIKQVCEHDYVEIEMINELITNYSTIVGREPPKLIELIEHNGTHINNMSIHPEPLLLLNQVNDNIPINNDQDIPINVKQDKSDILYNVVEIVLNEYKTQGISVVKTNDLSSKIKALLPRGHKTKYKYNNEKIIISELADELQIKITLR